MRVLIVLLVVALCPVLSDTPWDFQDSGTTARLRGLSVVDDQIA